MSIDIPGVDAVVAWFGEWPSFHDAEILSVHIERGATSHLRIRSWNTARETDDKGPFRRTREAVVVFEFSGISDIHLEGEDADRQNVIAGLNLERISTGYRVTLSPSYGIAGYFVVRELALRLET